MIKNELFTNLFAVFLFVVMQIIGFKITENIIEVKGFFSFLLFFLTWEFIVALCITVAIGFSLLISLWKSFDDHDNSHPL